VQTVLQNLMSDYRVGSRTGLQTTQLYDIKRLKSKLKLGAQKYAAEQNATTLNSCKPGECIK